MITEGQIQDAVQTLLSTRAEYSDFLDLREPKRPELKLLLPPLPGPASAEDIDKFEAAAGGLPPSFRHFLNMHDGIPKFDLGSDLLPVSAILPTTRDLLRPPLADMLNIINRINLHGLLIIGATKRGTIRFLFDTEKVDKDGEWKVIEFSDLDNLCIEHNNFYEFLVDVTEVMREAAGLG